MSSPVSSPRRRLLAVVVALLAGALLVPGVASAAKVRSLQPWAAPNTYLVTADLDGRRAPRLNPVARVDHLKAGQWVRITCQVTGQAAYGSRVWLKVNGYFVPDRYVKTYTDGFLRGAPTCNANDSNPYVPAQPTAPSPATLAVIARAVEFERVGGSNYGRYKKLYPSSRKATNGKSINWGTNGCSVPEALAKAEIGFANFKGKPVAYYSDLFRKSCDRHDFGYRNFGAKSGGLAIDPSKSGKKAIDDRFRSNMKIQCSQRFDRDVVEFVQRKFCNEVADTFWEAVTLFGGKNYFL